VLKKFTASGKDSNMTIVHFLSLHPVLTCPSISAQNVYKICQHEGSNLCSKSVSQQVFIIMPGISYISIFFPILLSKVNNGGDEMLQA